MNKLFFCRFIFYDVGVKSYIFCDWQLHIFFVLWQLNKSMFLVFRFRERAIYHPYASSKVLHFSFPLVYLISLVIFREATLKPKNCLVLSVPLTGIWSTRYLFRMTDGTVSTPFRILPIHAQVASFHISDDSKIRLLDFNGTIMIAVLSFIAGLHWFWYGHPSHWYL